MDWVGWDEEWLLFQSFFWGYRNIQKEFWQVLNYLQQWCQEEQGDRQCCTVAWDNLGSCFLEFPTWHWNIQFYYGKNLRTFLSEKPSQFIKKSFKCRLHHWLSKERNIYIMYIHDFNSFWSYILQIMSKNPFHYFVFLF